MIAEEALKCPDCGGCLKHYDQVNRNVRTKGRVLTRIRLNRSKCTKCNKIHREIPSYIYPLKRYEAEIIMGVLEGFITPDTYGYEDYPCEMTMVRWKSQKLQILL